MPVIAHPDKNLKIIENPRLVYDLIMNGSMIQINGTSLLGFYGKQVKKTAELLLKHQMVHFAATDAHSPRHGGPVLSKIWDLTEKIGGRGTAKKLIHTNPMAVVENKDIIIEKPIKINVKTKLL